jgi:hypothetical protein
LRIGTERVLCLWRSSAESAADMSTRRTEDGAWKWALRHFRRELVTRRLRFMAAEAASFLTCEEAAVVRVLVGKGA